MKTERFPWLATFHAVADFEQASDRVRVTKNGEFLNERGDLLLPPEIFPLPPGEISPEHYLSHLPYVNGRLESGLHFFLLIQAGAFAAALWQDGGFLKHKVKKRYVVRAGAGRAQSKQNSRRRTHSTGSQLRARNETALFSDLQLVLTQWKGYLAASSTLFYSLPVRLWSPLFSQPGTCLPPAADPRWRKIPLDLGRPGMPQLRRAAFEMTHGSVRINAPEI